MGEFNPLWGAVNLHLSMNDNFGSVSIKTGSTSPLYITNGFLGRLIPDSGCLDLLFLTGFVGAPGALPGAMGNMLPSPLTSLLSVVAVLPDAPLLRGD